MRKFDGRAVAEKFGGGYRLRVSAKSGEEVYIDLSSDAALVLRSELGAESFEPTASPVEREHKPRRHRG